MKQTAVEQLEHEVSNLVVTTKEYVMILINQAKEVERREKAEEYLNGFKDGTEYQTKLDELTFKNKSVNYDETDVAKALSKIIKDPNAEEFVKLLTPMICTSQQGTEHFFKLLIGNKLPDVIPNGTHCRMSISNIGYGVDKELTKREFADSYDNIIVTVKDFRGHHEYSQYVVEYVAVVGIGTNKRDTTYVRGSELEIIEDF